MIKSIVIYLPTKEAYFEVGKNLIRGEEKTEILIKKISYFNKKSRIKLSDKSELCFFNFPISLERI